MKWASAISEKESLADAVEEAAAALRGQLKGARPDLLLAFVSNAFADAYDEAGERIQEAVPSRLFIGTGAVGVVGAAREVEGHPAVSLIAAILPDVSLTAFALQDEDMPDLDASPRAWEEMTGVKAADDPQFLILADPFSIRVDALLMGLDYAYPKAAKIGGLSSGAEEPRGNALFLNALCLRNGAVGVAMSGNIRLDSLVAQGCRPVGLPLRVTESRQNVLISLDGKPPLEALQDVAKDASPHDRTLMQSALFLGLQSDSTREGGEPGDYLVRNIVGLDRQRGYLAIGALPRPGQTVRFHVRDAKASADDMKRQLAQAAVGAKPSGALLFSCVGRGKGLYGEDNFDSNLLQKKWGPMPLGGCFCHGEIGPVHGTTYLHGYTSCFGLFSPKT